MKTRRIILLVALIFVLALVLTSCGNKQHEHKWSEATCTSPKTCTECGATEGEALGHTERVIPGKEADREMDPTDPDRNGLETGAADDCKGAVGLQLAFFVKHSNHSIHAIIRCDYLLKDPSFI